MASDLLNQVLLDRVPFRRFREPDGSEGARFDTTSVGPVVEELVALAASKIVVPQSSVIADVIDSLPKILRDRVAVESDDHPDQQCRAIFEPLEHELETNPDRNVTDALSRGRRRLLVLLQGMHYRCQVDLSVLELKHDLPLLRRASSDPTARAVLAHIEGIVTTYRSHEMSAVVIRSEAPPEQVLRFEQLLRDAEYQALSRAAFELGIPARAGYAFGTIRSLVARLVERERLSAVLSAGSRLISFALGVPLPTSNEAASLLGKGYIPPLVGLRHLVDEAVKHHEASGRGGHASGVEAG